MESISVNHRASVDKELVPRFLFETQIKKKIRPTVSETRAPIVRTMLGRFMNYAGLLKKKNILSYDKKLKVAAFFTSNFKVLS